MYRIYCVCYSVQQHLQSSMSKWKKLKVILSDNVKIKLPVYAKPIKETQTSMFESSLRPFCASIVLNWWPGPGGCCERWADKMLKLTRKGNRFEQKASKVLMGTSFVLISRVVVFSESRLILHSFLVSHMYCLQGRCIFPSRFSSLLHTSF